MKATGAVGPVRHDPRVCTEGREVREIRGRAYGGQKSQGDRSEKLER